MNAHLKLLGTLGLMVAFASLGSGCASVYMSAPAGSKPHALQAAHWNGVWATEDGWCQLRVADAANGRLELSEIKVRDDLPRLETSHYLIREAGNLLFANLQCEEERSGQYIWFRIRRDADHILVWWPDPKKVGQLVRAGKLEGRIDKEDVFLQPLGDEVLQRLITTDPGSILDDKAPGVLRRVFSPRKPAPEGTS